MTDRYQEYLRRNLLHAKACGAKANASTALKRLEMQTRPPQWLVNALRGILERVDQLPAELARWRDLAPDTPDYVRAEMETSQAPSPSVLDRLVTVCGACETAACWQGSFMCDSAEMAGIKNLTVRELHEKPRGENAQYWFKDADGKIDKTLLEIYQRMTSQRT